MIFCHKASNLLPSTLKYSSKYVLTDRLSFKSIFMQKSERKEVRLTGAL